MLLIVQCIAGRWFSPCTPVSFTNKTDRHDMAEILFKVALSIIILIHVYAILLFIKFSWMCTKLANQIIYNIYPIQIFCTKGK